MIASLKTLLLDAQKNKYAVGAFNVLNLEYAVGLIRAAQEKNSSIILQISPSVIQLFGLKAIVDPCLALADQSNVPICVHLDHGKTRQDVVESINVGFSSVMFDGSSLPIQSNIEETVFLTKLAHQHNISIEAEIGKVGKEEDGGEDLNSSLTLTKLEDVLEFSEKTQIDALAISIGSVHGVKNPHINLDIELLQKIKKEINIPLVLHGSSGVNDSSILLAIEAGITKINVATRLKVSVAHALYTLCQNYGESELADSKLLSNTIIDAVRQEASSRIQLFNSLHK
jgi:fructose-bisphosphate aldolase class II